MDEQVERPLEMMREERVSVSKLRTYLDGGDTEAAGFEDNPDAARRHALAEPAHHSTRHQHVLHPSLSLSL